MSIETLFQAAAERRFLATAWPWRSAAYLGTTLLVAAAVLPAVALLTLPWLTAAVLASESATNGEWPPFGPLLLLIAAGTAMVAGFGPLVALPVAALERRRLRLADARPVFSGHRTPAPGLWAWLRTRYTEPATWRALGYLMLLVSVLTLLTQLAVLLVLLALVLAASPLIVLAEEGAVALGTVEATEPGQAIPFAVVGVVLLAAMPYVLALCAGVHAAIARGLLDRGREELHAELAEVAHSRARLVDAFEAERRRIERDLHDGAQQRLVNLTLQLGLARMDLPSGSTAAEQVEGAHEQAKELLTELRELVHAIHPRILTDRGLAAALPDLAERCPVPVEFHLDLPGRLPGHVESAAYFAVAEALANVAKHSGAERARVTAALEAGLLVVEVGDDGKGGADPRNGTGLTGLADRVAVVSGRILLSSPSGGPTLLRVELPCRPSSE